MEIMGKKAVIVGGASGMARAAAELSVKRGRPSPSLISPYQRVVERA